MKTCRRHYLSVNNWNSPISMFHVVCLYLLGLLTVLDTSITTWKFNIVKRSQCRGKVKLVPDVDAIVFTAIASSPLSNGTFICQFRRPKTRTWKQLCEFQHDTCIMDNMCYCAAQNPWTVHIVISEFYYAKSSIRMFLRTGTESHWTKVLTVPKFYRAITEAVIANGLEVPFTAAPRGCLLTLPLLQEVDITYCVNIFTPAYQVMIRNSQSGVQELWVNASQPCISAKLQLVSSSTNDRLVNHEMISGQRLDFGFQELVDCRRGKLHSCTIRGYLKSLVIEPFQQRNTGGHCTEGVVENQFFFFHGSVNTTGVNILSRPQIYNVQIGDPQDGYTTVSTINVKKDGCGQSSRPNHSYCVRMVASVTYIIVNLTAKLTYNKFMFMKLTWPERTNGEYDEGRPVRLPIVHKSLAPVLKIDFEDLVLKDSSSFFNLQMTRGVASSIQFCTQVEAIPARLKIIINGVPLVSKLGGGCVKTVYTPGCQDFKYVYVFNYKENYGCQRNKYYVTKGVIPLLKVNNSTLDIENASCRFDWPVNNTRAEKLVIFCTINLPKPYKLTAFVGKVKLNTTSGPCVTLQQIPRGGRLNFLTESECQSYPSYTCQVELNDNGVKVEALMTIDGEDSYIFNHNSCRMFLEKGHNTSMSFCLFGLTPPYMASFQVPGVFNDDSYFEESTDDCLELYFTPKSFETYLVTFADSFQRRKFYECQVSWLGLDKIDLNRKNSLSDDKDTEKNTSTIHRGPAVDDDGAQNMWKLLIVWIVLSCVVLLLHVCCTVFSGPKKKRRRSDGGSFEGAEDVKRAESVTSISSTASSFSSISDLDSTVENDDLSKES